MNETNRTLQTAERLIRERFPEHFGDGCHIDRIDGSSFRRKDHEINYITVYLAPGSPTLDHQKTNDFDILIKKELIDHNIRDWPAVAFVTQNPQLVTKPRPTEKTLPDQQQTNGSTTQVAPPLLT